MYYFDPINVECGLSNSQFDTCNNEMLSQQDFVECSIVVPENECNVQYDKCHNEHEVPRQELEYNNSIRFLEDHGIKLCSYSNFDGSYDFAITVGDNIVPEDAFLQMNVFGVDGEELYRFLNEFALDHKEKQFKLAEVAKFFEDKGYDVASCR